MSTFLDTPISFLKGVGPQRAELLNKELGIYTFGDLLNHYPFRYIDRSEFNQIREVPGSDGFVQLKGFIAHVSETGIGRQKRLVARLQDTTGSIDLVWFQGIKWVKPLLKPNIEFVVFGKAKIFNGQINIPHPEIEELSSYSIQTGVIGVYNSTEKLSKFGLHSRGLLKLIQQLFAQIPQHAQEELPEKLIRELNLLSRPEALRQVHNPSGEPYLKQALFRLKFEELFYLQIELLLRKQITLQKSKGFIFEEVGEHFLNFYDRHMPFELTNAQKRVVKEIRMDMKKGFHMNRLLQGDVGSGKTLVGLLSMLIATGNDFQAAMMAPTEILAQQHYESIRELLMDTGIEVAKLTGSVKRSEKNRLLEELKGGKINILIGTHALIEDNVIFNNLGLVIIDEQHRFGVAQRAKLWAKNSTPPHILVMTATPIPRTLAMTVYGDLDVSVIDELPPGRQAITTEHRFEKDRLVVFGFIKREIEKGRQVYVVYPLIKESESMDYHNLMEGFESMSRYFPLPSYQISIVHGQLKPEAKEYEMKRFVEGKTQIMVATTVIEVGVNVPNASVMIIESAERFGLSQLHQLRGRVGRGAEKSYCILMTGNKLSRESKKRISTMVLTQDGFEIAEADMELRGPGDLLGTQQSGILNLKIADLSSDGHIVAEAREKARELLSSDGQLQLPEHQYIRKKVIKLLEEKPNWSSIS